MRVYKFLLYFACFLRQRILDIIPTLLDGSKLLLLTAITAGTDYNSDAADSA